MKKFTFIIVLALMTAAVSGQLFTEDFEDGNADARWTVVEDAGPNSFAFAVDYVTDLSIPAAPNGGGLGLKLQVNLGAGDPPAGVASQLYAFPKGQSFTAPYQVKMDVYMFHNNGAGSTEYGVFGVMHTSEVVPSDNGIDYAVTCDNGSSKDVWVYVDGVGLVATDFEGGYTGLDPADGVTPTQNIAAGISYVEAFTETVVTDMDFGNEWNTVVIDVTADSVIWSINDVVFSAMEYTPVDGNISVGLMDLFSSISGDGDYTIYDNISVTALTEIKDHDVSTISMYPNPVTDVLNVVVTERSSFELINTIGQAVLRTELEGTSTVDVSGLKTGMYFARVISEKGQIETQKILVK